MADGEPPFSDYQVEVVRVVVGLGAEYPSPKKVNLSIMVGLYKPKKVKGYLLSY